MRGSATISALYLLRDFVSTIGLFKEVSENTSRTCCQIAILTKEVP